ncbi:125 kDa kinesin-related protein [Morus notabilis]|uniref:125 kDa kinesin-related protein n=1 Tax=Morus notabilis TaxID=981085 RepID=W9R499_9ROSA|nr:kinesin-like protein KIN-5B isoform X2 [Morus notabilis]EXB67891.1 125 kDa kinesin-related protein [Morus notabilis]
MSVTPDLCRKVGMGIAPSPSPFLTPRPERHRHTGNWSSTRPDRDKEVNIQVLLRCRPLSEEEQRSNVQKVISCNEHKREVTVLQSVANKQIDRVFTFDKVFGPKSQQRSIYDQAISPIVNEVLEGFNCTVFAYGQTGTGKTYTMEGGMRNKGGDLPAEAGVIPRAVRQIFDTLEAQSADYSMKVTFLELYNEEITDLLAPDDNSRSAAVEDRQKKPISLMEDGKGCVVVRGLEEEAVYSVNEIYTLLEQGASKRRTADTLLNKRSSRSHSVFSITVHIKEAAVGDEELIKCGKLNLVDLAGSENISRSGAREGRAREAGEINKSLLTLGRVINALVEHSSHIPYRDSKLTRLLRDSLGGKTKTCIIATISPSAHSLEETLSTLDYAYRAKNIKNKPEANQKMSKAVLLKDLYLELEKMKEDIRAAREKNGVYIPHERFAQDEAEKKARNEKIEQLENDLNLAEKQVDSFRELYISEQEEKLDLQKELNDCKISLENSNKALLELQENYRVAMSTLREKELIISSLLSSENSLIECAKGMRNDLQHASEDISSLFAQLDQKDKMEAENQNLLLTFGSQLDHSLKDLHKTILGSVLQQTQQMRSMEEHFRANLASKCDVTQALESRVSKMTETYCSGVASLKELANMLQRKASSDLEQIYATISSQAISVENFLATMVMDAEEVISYTQSSLNKQKQLLDFSTKQQEEGLKRSLIAAQMISSATMKFFNDLNDRASQVSRILEESENERSNQLGTFEKMFKEEAAREERAALENIAAILATVTSKKIAMVSEASRNILDTNKQENKRLLREMSNMQQGTIGATTELSEFLEKAENHYMEDTFSVAEHRTFMENCLHQCSERVDYSRQQWRNAQSSIKNLNEKSVAEIQSAVKENISTNHVAHKEFVSASLKVDDDFNASAIDTLTAINDSLLQDQENKKESDSMTALCLDELKSIQEKHGKSISDIRTQAEKCFIKDYMVDQHNSTTPKKRIVSVPSLTSIEEMRSPAFENVAEKKLTWSHKHTESKIPHLAFSPLRTPFTDIN